MPPPQLARDAPRLDILKPVVIHLLAAFRHDLGAAFAHSIQRGPNDLGGIDEPLVGQHRLDHHFGAVTEGLHDFLLFDVRYGAFNLFAFVVLDHLGGHDRVAFGRDVRNHAFARLEPV